MMNRLLVALVAGSFAMAAMTPVVAQDKKAPAKTEAKTDCKTAEAKAADCKKSAAMTADCKKAETAMAECSKAAPKKKEKKGGC